MNQAKVVESNKHRLEVARALLAKDGSVKHVQHLGKSILYVSLPALSDELFKSHSIYIPSYAAFARTLDHPLALRDRLYSHRFTSQSPKETALAFKWPSDRDKLPTAEELAHLLHLDETLMLAALKPAGSAGAASGLEPAVGAEAASLPGATPHPAAAGKQAVVVPVLPSNLNPLFQTLPKGVGVTWGRRSRASLAMRQLLWQQKQQELQQGVNTPAGSSGSPQQSADVHGTEQPLITPMAEQGREELQLAKHEADGVAVSISTHTPLNTGNCKNLKVQGLQKQQDAGAAAPVEPGARANGAGTAAAQQRVGPAGSGHTSAGVSSGSSSNQSGQNGAPSSADNVAAAPGAATNSNAATSAGVTGDEEQQHLQQQERNIVAHSRTSSSNNLLAGQPQQQVSASKRQMEQAPQPEQQLQQGEEPVGNKKRRTTPPLSLSGQDGAAAAAAAAVATKAPAAAAASSQPGSKPRVRPLPSGMRVTHMAAVHQAARQHAHGQHHHHEQQQQQGVLPSAPMGSQQVMQQQLKHMLGLGRQCAQPMHHSSFISLGGQQQQQHLMAADHVYKAAAGKQHKQLRQLQWQQEHAPQQQQQHHHLQHEREKPRVLPLPLAMQVHQKTEQQRLQLQNAFRQVWQYHHKQQQRKPGIIKARVADMNTVGQAAGCAGQPGMRLSGQPDVHPPGQPGANLSGQPGASLSGQPGALSSEPRARSSGQADEAAGKFSMKAVFSGRQMKRLQQLFKQQAEESEGQTQQQQPHGLSWQAQQLSSQRTSAHAHGAVDGGPTAGFAAPQHLHSKPLKRKALETGTYLLGAGAAAAAAAGAAPHNNVLLPPPQRRKRSSSDAGLMSDTCSGIEHMLTPEQVQQVQSLLGAVCVMVGAAGLQHLGAAIDQLLLAGAAPNDVQRQGGRDQASTKQQQQQQGSVLNSAPGNLAAAAASEIPLPGPAAASEKVGISTDLLAAVRWLAARLASMQLQQELVIPTLQSLCKDCPHLLGSTSSLDGQSLLSLTIEQLQAFFAAVLGLELCESMQHMGIKPIQNSSNGQSTKDSAAQQQQTVPGKTTTVNSSITCSALLQQQQEFATALVAEYKAGGQVVRCRPKTLMILAADRMMAAVVQQAQQQDGAGGLVSPAAQAAAVAGVAARLASRELQFAAATATGVSSFQQPGTGAAGTANSLKQLAGSDSTAAAGTSGTEQRACSSSSSNIGLHALNSILLRSQFHPELQSGQLSVDMPNRCVVAAAPAGTVSDLRISSAATVVTGFRLQDPQGSQGSGAEPTQGERTEESADAAEHPPLANQVLASWLCIGPDVALWQLLLALLLQLQQEKQQQDNSKQGTSNDAPPQLSVQQQQHQQLDLQQCHTKAQELICSLQLQADDILALHQQLKAGVARLTNQQQQCSGIVVLQQTPGQGIFLHPGWLHLQVNHMPNLTVWCNVLRPCDAAAAAVVQRELPWLPRAEQQAAVHVGPLVLKTLQQWYVFCQQQRQQ